MILRRSELTRIVSGSRRIQRCGESEILAGTEITSNEGLIPDELHSKTPTDRFRSCSPQSDKFSDSKEAARAPKFFHDGESLPDFKHDPGVSSSDVRSTKTMRLPKSPCSRLNIASFSTTCRIPSTFVGLPALTIASATASRCEIDFRISQSLSRESLLAPEP